jgi:hypothetical protein
LIGSLVDKKVLVQGKAEEAGEPYDVDVIIDSETDQLNQRINHQPKRKLTYQEYEDYTKSLETKK